MITKPKSTLKLTSMKLENNKNVIQSYILTTAKYDFSVYEKRILYRIVEMYQHLLQGKKLSERYRIDKNIFGDQIVTMPVDSILTGDSDQNYTRIKQALIALRNKTFEYNDGEKWKLIGIVEKPVLDKQGVIEFEMRKEVFEPMLDFSKGYRKLELKVAMSFESIYAMRFYELLSGQKHPITYRIEHLKIIFSIEDKYKLNADFIRKVIDPAKKELDAKSPFSFEYTPVKIGRKIESIKFYPYEIPENRDEELERKELQRQTSLAWDLDKIYIDYLEQNFAFSRQEIKNNRDLFIKAQEKLDLLLELSRLKVVAAEKDNPKGYVINAIKNMIKGVIPIK